MMKLDKFTFAPDGMEVSKVLVKVHEKPELNLQGIGD